MIEFDDPIRIKGKRLTLPQMVDIANGVHMTYFGYATEAERRVAREEDYLLMVSTRALQRVNPASRLAAMLR